MRRLNIVESDMDGRTYVRIFSGRMTKMRYKVIDRYCRRNSVSERCHHDYDCCGCCFRTDYWFEYSKNQIKVFIQYHYNL